MNDKGWQIVRVWSTDWFDHPALQTDRLVTRLQELRNRPTATEEDYVIARAPEPEAREKEPAAPGHDLSIEPQAADEDIVPFVDLDPPTDGPLSEAECFEVLCGGCVTGLSRLKLQTGRPIGRCCAMP